MQHPITLLLALGLAAPLSAQTHVPFPMTRTGADGMTGGLVLHPDAEGIRSLVGRERLIMTDFEMPSGEKVDLDLERIEHESIRFGFQVNGEPRPNLLHGLDLSIWKGTVIGENDSSVLLSFSRAGNRGWVGFDGDMAHLMPQAVDGNWDEDYAILADEASLARIGVNASFECGIEELGITFEDDMVPYNDDEPPMLTSETNGTLYGATVAIETDYELFLVFGDLNAETVYVTTLLTACSDRYIQAHRTQLDYPYIQFYNTNAADPWDTPGTPGANMIDMLDEFQAAWSGNIPEDATLAHFVSGSNFGGGVAYVGVLCDVGQVVSFAVSGNIDSGVQFPLVIGPFNWDYIVFNHETGHNFSCPHTHDFCPVPLDQCPPVAFGGGCQNTQICQQGTIMSYCHLCPGNTSNINLLFHDEMIEYVKPHVEGCLPLLVGITAIPPGVFEPEVPTVVQAEVLGTPVDGVNLHYKLIEGGNFQIVPMLDLGSDVWSGTLPAIDCGQTPEFFFEFEDATVGPVSSNVFSPVIGDKSTLFSDGFELDTGWTVGAADDDATNGIWERGNPNGTGAQPNDGAAIGEDSNCYFTQQGIGLGGHDVDDGKTTLISPVFNLAAGDAEVSYYRWFSNDIAGAPNEDVFRVQVTNNGTDWVDAEVVGPSGQGTSGDWHRAQFRVSDFVAPTATVQVRFVASDYGDPSLIEAGVDEFELFRLECEVCAEDLGFASDDMQLSLCGPPLGTSESVDFDLIGGPASSPAWIAFSTSSTPTPFEGGMLVTMPLVGTVGLVTNSQGEMHFGLPGDISPVDLYLQVVTFDLLTFEIELSNGVLADF